MYQGCKVNPSGLLPSLEKNITNEMHFPGSDAKI